MPDAMETTGLLALMVLTQARRPVRFDGGVLVPLAEQDRTLWDNALIAEGRELVRGCLRVNRPGPYRLLAAINVVHADARQAERTDWRQIVALYDQLLARAPTPVVALNRAVAVAEARSPLAGLDLIESIEGLAGYHALHAARADLLRRLGRSHAARESYQKAIDTAGNAPQRAYLVRMQAGLPDGPHPRSAPESDEPGR